MEIQKERPLVNVKVERNCLHCQHLAVCVVYRSTVAFLKTVEDIKPFGAEEIAKICNRFNPIL